MASLGRLCRQHRVELIAIGNGTASGRDRAAGRRGRGRQSRPDAREGHCLGGRRLGLLGLGDRVAELHRSRRVASRRRLDRPPAPGSARRAGEDRPEKSIGVGQYQHDVSETKLSRQLSAVVEDACERRGRRREHRLPCPARAGLGPRRVDGRPDRRPPGRERPVPGHGRRSRRCRVSVPRTFELARASCASRAATIRSTPPASIRKPYPVVRGSFRRPRAISGCCWAIARP